MLLFHETNEKHFQAAHSIPSKIPKIHQNPPTFLPILTQYLDNFHLNYFHIHFSPYFTENIHKYGTNLKGCLPKIAATPHYQTKIEALLSLAPAQTSSVIRLSCNLSQSQLSISNFKQFPKSNFFQELHILPHGNRWENDSYYFSHQMNIKNKSCRYRYLWRTNSG